MSTSTKRKPEMDDDKTPKKPKMECPYGDKCYRLNPIHFKEYSHAHLESILDSYTGSGDFPLPSKYNAQRQMYVDQLKMMLHKQIYTPGKNFEPSSSTSQSSEVPSPASSGESSKEKSPRVDLKTTETRSPAAPAASAAPASGPSQKNRDSDYHPIVPPTRRVEDFLTVVAPRGKMAAKHAAAAPYYIFYTTIKDSKQTHVQPYSITFQEILDRSLGELRCSLQINFMVEIGWLLAQYYFAGYSEKKLTILYGEECSELKNITKKKPRVEAHQVTMSTPFGKHHTKMMILCYEDGSLRVVISTANLYYDDWENRTQGLWFSPACPELPADAMPHDGESPTMFKRSLLRYLNHYHLAALAYYVERVKRCDFSHINVFLVASVPGSHPDMDWGMLRVGTLLRQHCAYAQKAPLIAQASSIGSYGKEPKLWLTGDFLHNFTKSRDMPQMLSAPPELKIIYPSLQNVRQSHDDLLGGGCLPYAADAHAKQTWLNDFLYQWQARHTARNKAMPHIKSYTRLVGGEGGEVPYYLLTSANISKAAWGQVNKGNGALRLMSYEAGVLFLPKFVINADFFPLSAGAKNRLIIPYDLPPVKYTQDMNPWVSDYLR
ncbi:tyrosyl-DNA phosphodiesterase glaikit isoform X2 [Anticarsia gemmatalis]|uniref:tyrosyl-DNA phosphodiesterase glaikit isoform X2 n=1 Tax=Anticarsia gemmatalis TaxID=129554 RepID=UPI003F768081